MCQKLGKCPCCFMWLPPDHFFSFLLPKFQFLSRPCQTFPIHRSFFQSLLLICQTLTLWFLKIPAPGSLSSCPLLFLSSILVSLNPHKLSIQSPRFSGLFPPTSKSLVFCPTSAPYLPRYSVGLWVHQTQDLKPKHFIVQLHPLIFPAHPGEAPSSAHSSPPMRHLIHGPPWLPHYSSSLVCSYFLPLTV